MAQIKIKAQTRKPGRKGPARRLRASGKVPGIIYAKGIQPIPIELDAREVYSLTHGRHAASLESVLVSLEIQDAGDDNPRPALITEVQRDPIKGNPLHIDFHQVSLTEKIHARIPVVTIGDSPGLSAGGILEHTLRELDVACLPMDLPEQITVDISQLQQGQSIHVKDVFPGPKTEILNDPDLSVVSVSVPRVVAAAAAEKEEEEVLEPEVITAKEGKEEVEGETPKEEKGA